MILCPMEAMALELEDAQRGVPAPDALALLDFADQGRELQAPAGGASLAPDAFCQAAR